MNMNQSYPLQQPQQNTAGSDLQFTTSVDNTTTQNVPIPSVPTLQPGQGQQLPQNASVIDQLYSNSAHPIPCIFHVLFKGLALTLYLLGGLFQHGSNFITITVCCILLHAVDFWVVKNITGRLLVGLRWWAQVDLSENEYTSDETRWIFESKENVKINSFDQTWFWTVLYVTPAVWMWFLFIGVMRLRLGWLITVMFGVGLNIANVYGYWRCSKDQKAKFQAMVQKGAEMGAVSAIRHNVFGRMASLAGNMAGSSNNQQSTVV